MIQHSRFSVVARLAQQLPLLLLCGLLGLTGTIYADSRAMAESNDEGIVSGQLQFWEDPSTTITFAQMLRQEAQFTKAVTTTPNFGFTQSAYWLRIPVTNPQPTPGDFYLNIENSLIDHLTFYVVSEGRLQVAIESGDQIAASQHPYRATTFVLPFHLPARGSATLYIRAQSDSAPLFIPFSILTEPELIVATSHAVVWHSVILGSFGMLFIYNLFVFLLLRSRLYFYYVLYLPIAYMATTSISGFGPAFLYPNNTWLNNEGLVFFSELSLTLMLLFAREFLQTHTMRRLDGWLRFFILWTIVQSCGIFLWPTRLAYEMTTAMLFIFPLLCLLAGSIAWRQGRTEARFYLVGQGASWLGMFLFGLMGLDVLAYHLLLYQGLAISVVIDAFMLSFALADRIRILQKARLQAEDKARKNLEIHQEELEQLVIQRTAEIKTLHGSLPICANCKKIRDDQGAWQQLEIYISQHTDAAFSHGICADCMAELSLNLCQT